jgi:N-acetylglucosamine-6-phosphate deacetylase
LQIEQTEAIEASTNQKPKTKNNEPPMPQYLTHLSVFTGCEWMHHCHVLIDGDRLLSISNDVVDVSIEQVDCKGKMLVPAFVDLQVYGGGGKLFSQYPTAASLQALAAQNKLGGTAACLVTIATQPLQVILSCLDAVHEFILNGGEGIAGLHLEGPFINPEKRGAHVREWIHAPTMQEADLILEHAKGHLKMITLAPECCSQQVLDKFSEAGVVISAGHSNAGFGEAKQFAQRGVGMVTHLFNAMSALHHREPGLPLAAMMDTALTASIIPDGIHVHYSIIKMAKQMMGDRLLYITDAVTPTLEGPYQHVAADKHYALPDGTLSGSSISMLQAVQNGIQHCGFPPAESLRMAALYPARVLGMEAMYGTLQQGSAIKALLLDDQWRIESTIGF